MINRDYNEYQESIIRLTHNMRCRKHPVRINISRIQYLFEHKFFHIKLPRQIGKTTIINELALGEDNFKIFVHKQNAENRYHKTLRNNILSKCKNLSGFRFDCEAIFFDEVPDAPEFIRLNIDRFDLNKLEYIVSLYT